MLYAVIDIGSTTIRMAIYEILDNKLNLIHKRKYTVGLASYVKDNVMEQAGIDKACEILNSFKSFLTSFNIENVSIHSVLLEIITKHCNLLRNYVNVYLTKFFCFPQR